MDSDEDELENFITPYEEIRKPIPLEKNSFCVKLDQKNVFEVIIFLHVTLFSQIIKCPICFEVIKNTVVTLCLHRFCQGCIEKALRLKYFLLLQFCKAIKFNSKNECPSCRTAIPSKRYLRRDFNLDAIIQKLFPNRVEFQNEQSEELKNVIFLIPSLFFLDFSL
jgi:hypothetical protein